MGSRVHKLLANLCVTLSLNLFALGGTESIGGFCLRTLSYSRPTTTTGPILDMVAVSRIVVGTSWDELGGV
jgi:hypothetical protein